jgi:phospho-N-acetylmuramoyl-pentapeptide-transferase
MESSVLLLNVFKVFGLAAFSFMAAFILTPLLTHYLYKNKLWIKQVNRATISGEKATIVGELVKDRSNSHTPRLGGVLVWGTTVLITLFLWVLSIFTDNVLLDKLNFFSRNQTWLPLAALVAASLVGFVDDWMHIHGKGKYIGGGLELTYRITWVLVIGAIGAWWFYVPLEVNSVFIPFWGDLYLGILFIPIFMLTMLAVFSSGIIDGLDGLAGGVLASVIAAYGGIAFFQSQIDLAAFLGVIGGALLAFLWYNIPPARFYMGETGMLGLTVMLTVVAFLTGAVAVLPIIAFPLVLETSSAMIQVVSKKYRGRKVFRAAPLHHHFEAMGWPHYKVTMRFWIVSMVTALMGMVIHLIGK